MSIYRKHFNVRETPQREQIPGRDDQVANSEGGYVWSVDDWIRLDRFLIQGSEGGTFYIAEHELTVQNAKAVARCLNADGPRTVKRIVEISEAGRAPKNDPALFALAMAASEQFANKGTRQAALEALPRVARIGTHLFTFLELVEGLRGWGRGLRDAVAAWYNDKDPGKLAYQVIKYRQRGGWAHRDALRLSRPVPVDDAHNAIYHWVTQGAAIEPLEPLIQGFLEAQGAQDAKAAIGVLSRYPGLPWEALPAQVLREPGVWEAMLPKMPMGAMVRNLARMTNIGLIAPYSDATRLIMGKLNSQEAIQKSRLHPVKILAALLTYQKGHGSRGKLTWTPDNAVLDALDNAFYIAFGNVKPTGKRLCLGVDISLSMNSPELQRIPGMTPRIAAAAMAMVTMRTEDHPPAIMGFSSKFTPITIGQRQRLDDVVRYMDGLPHGGTDCSLPMRWAQENMLNFDAFLVYTDNETWAGPVHACQALNTYRQVSGIPAKLAVVSILPNEFSIADPDDAYTVDFVGFDTATPELISDFVRE